jgi:HEAT repeat protein
MASVSDAESSQRPSRGGSPVKRAFLLLFLAPLMLVAVRGAVRADEDDPELKGHKASEYIALMQKLAADKPASDQERVRNLEKRRAILDALEVLGPKAPRILQAVNKAIHDDPESDIRESAARWLGRVAQKIKDQEIDARDSIDALVTALKTDKSVKVREGACVALDALAKARVDIGQALATLIATLKDQAPEPRAAAAHALGRLRGTAKEAVPLLREILRDPKGDVFGRRESALALVKIAPADPDILTTLTETLGAKDTPSEVREEVARVLGLLGEKAAPAIPVLAVALHDKKSLDVRRAAAAALDQVGPEVKSVLPALLEAIDDKDRDRDKAVRCLVIHTIGGLGKDGAEATEQLIKCAKDSNQEVRLAAIHALRSIGPDAARAKDLIPLLTALTTDPQADIREAAIEALKKVQEK